MWQEHSPHYVKASSSFMNQTCRNVFYNLRYQVSEDMYMLKQNCRSPSQQILAMMIYGLPTLPDCPSLRVSKASG